LIMVQTTKKVFAIFPRLIPELLTEVGKALRRDAKGKRIFVHGAERLLRFCEAALEWKPEVTDLTDLCAKQGWKPNFDLLTEKVVGGVFCRRATVFGGDALPSAQVLKYQSVGVSLIFEFGLKFWESPQRRATEHDRRMSQAGGRDRSPLGRR
jgi:hypothetical protein